MDGPRRGLEVIQSAQPRLCFLKEIDQSALVEGAVVAPDLEGSDARREVDNARQVQSPELQIEGVNPEAQLEVQDDGTIFDEKAPIPLPSVGDLGPASVSGKPGQNPLIIEDRRRTAPRGRRKAQHGVLGGFGLRRL